MVRSFHVFHWDIYLLIAGHISVFSLIRIHVAQFQSVMIFLYFIISGISASIHALIFDAFVSFDLYGKYIVSPIQLLDNN